MLVQSSPQDGITSLKWSPTGNFLVATGWDNKVLCYDVQPNGQALPKAAMEAHEAPVMASVWSPDGSAVFSGGCDNQAKKWDLGSNQTTQVAQHDGPIRHMAWIQQHNILCTGSWDKTLKYWDARQPESGERGAVAGEVLRFRRETEFIGVRDSGEAHIGV